MNFISRRFCIMCQPLLFLEGAPARGRGRVKGEGKGENGPRFPSPCIPFARRDAPPGGLQRPGTCPGRICSRGCPHRHRHPAPWILAPRRRCGPRFPSPCIPFARRDIPAGGPQRSGTCPGRQHNNILASFQIKAGNLRRGLDGERYTMRTWEVISTSMYLYIDIDIHVYMLDSLVIVQV